MQRKRTLRPADTRVISLLGHRASGKTTLGDRMLHVAGVTRSPGSVDDRTSLLDFRPDERARRASVEPSLAWLLWDGARIELVDLPGSDATPGRSAALLHATDGRVV
ncbi:MAG: elongation factor G, partial [Myxococcota bacterium]